MNVIKKLIPTLLGLLITTTGLFGVDRAEVVLREDFASLSIKDFDCHSSSIIETSPGILLAVWKGGPGIGLSNCDMKQNIGIWSSKYENNRWSTPEQIIECLDSVCWTPILSLHPDGTIQLFYRIGSDPRHTTSLVMSSFDHGVTWESPKLLPAGIVGPTKAPPIFDRNGNMFCGSSVEVGSPTDVLKATSCFIEILSTDGTWSKSGPIQIPGKQFGCIEPSLFWANDGVLKLVCRDRSNRIGLEGWIWTAESHDLGKTWSTLTPTSLPNPDSGIATLRLDAERTLLFYNNSSTNRYPLTVALSTDQGVSWTPLFDLEKESGEFPSVTLDSEGNVHILYAYVSGESPQRCIKHLVLDAKKLTK